MEEKTLYSSLVGKSVIVQLATPLLVVVGDRGKPAVAVGLERRDGQDVRVPRTWNYFEAVVVEDGPNAVTLEYQDLGTEGQKVRAVVGHHLIAQMAFSLSSPLSIVDRSVLSLR